MNHSINGHNNTQITESTVNMMVGNVSLIQMSANELREIMEDARKYKELGEEILQHAEKWERMHPKAQKAIEDCDYCPSQILP